jgi:hypothetical protein
MSEERKSYRETNETIKFEVMDVNDISNQVALMSFLRLWGLTHVYSEYIIPSACEGKSLTLAAVQDRPWPPWGIGVTKIHGLIHLYPVIEERAGIGGVFVSPEDMDNIGMITALYKEALEHLERHGKRELSYVVREDSVVAHRVLSSNGFEKSEDLFLTEQARYHVYRGDARDVLKKLGLSDISTTQLFGYEIPESVLERNALFHSTLQLGSWSFWHNMPGRPEVIPVLGDLLLAALPGGVDTPGPSGPAAINPTLITEEEVRRRSREP